jgi:hypothetical protein
MTDTGDHLTPPDPESGPVAEGGELPLASRLFKAVGADADSPSVNEALGGRPRLDRSPADTGGGRPATGSKGSRSGFTFDLGGALARLDGGAQQPPAAAPPAPVPPSEPASADDPPLTPLPRRGAVSPSPAARSEPEVRPAEPPPEPTTRSYVAPSHSVFDDIEGRPTATAITPSLPSARSAPVPSSPSLPAGPSLPTDVPTLRPAVESFGGGPTTLPPGGGIPSLPTVPTLPNLPPAPPPRPVMAAPVTSVPPPPDPVAVRAAQLRARQQQKQGNKFFGKALLAVVVLAAAIGGVLTFGRSRLFPNSWDHALTPIVDVVQQEHGAEFEHTVELVRQPLDEYQATASRLLFGDDWIARVPEWRAVGLAAGDPSPASVGGEIALRRLAVYDADADRIYMASDTDADTPAAVVDLRVALEAAYAAQQGGPAPLPPGNGIGLLGLSSPDVIVRRAVTRSLAERAAAIVDPAAPDASASVVSAGMPLPIEYELSATESLGSALLIGAGIDPATFTFESQIPAYLTAQLDDAPATTSGAVLQEGERALADPISLGVDDWSLVWGTRLPASTVDRLTEVVGADSYRPFDRAGVTCVGAVFESASPGDGGFVLSAMATWAAGAPPESQAVATSLSETLVQLISCDPGVTAAVVPQTTSVTQLLERQMARLSG